MHGTKSERDREIPTVHSARYTLIVLRHWARPEPTVSSLVLSSPSQNNGLIRVLSLSIDVGLLWTDDQASRRERLRKLYRVQRVTIMHEVAFPDEESAKTACQIPFNLGHP